MKVAHIEQRSSDLVCTHERSHGNCPLADIPSRAGPVSDAGTNEESQDFIPEIEPGMTDAADCFVR
jgi:hypothetical protein